MEKLCSIEDCQRPPYCKSMCSLHYQRVQKYGDPHRDRQSGALEAFADRFWSRVEKTDGCWWWTARKTHDGYGVVSINGKILRSHRVSYEAHHGDIPEGMSIDHVCHNRACVNPSHLRVVTHKQNHENRAGADYDSASGIRGVYWRKDVQKWHAQVKHNQKRLHVGYFEDIEEAKRAVIAKRKEIFTHNTLDRIA